MHAGLIGGSGLQCHESKVHVGYQNQGARKAAKFFKAKKVHVRKVHVRKLHVSKIVTFAGLLLERKECSKFQVDACTDAGAKHIGHIYGEPVMVGIVSNELVNRSRAFQKMLNFGE